MIRACDFIHGNGEIKGRAEGGRGGGVQLPREVLRKDME